MRHRILAITAAAALLAGACAELDGWVAAGTTEGKALLNRLNTAVNPPPDAVDPALVAPEPSAPAAGGSWGSAAPTPPPAPASPRPARQVPGAARERFLAAYALLGCAQAATNDPIERERRRAELFRLLNYSNFDWLDDLQTYGTAEGEALKALCLR